MLEKGPTEQLLRQAHQGDRAAFERLVEIYKPRLEALVRVKLGSELRMRVEVDDIIQETFVGAFDSIGTLRSPDETVFFRWLAGIANHVIFNEARRQHRRPTVPFESNATTSDPSPSKGMIRDERFERLAEALDSLSPDHREVIILARIEGLSLAEVAGRMHRTQGAVAQLLWRALKRLREQFGDTESFRLPDRRLLDRGRRDGT
jgi:RNA polymerase sigma-70 factor (ECF subfamily)